MLGLGGRRVTAGGLRPGVELREPVGHRLDDLHPDDAFYTLLNDRIHAELVRLLGVR